MFPCPPPCVSEGVSDLPFTRVGVLPSRLEWHARLRASHVRNSLVVKAVATLADENPANATRWRSFIGIAVRYGIVVAFVGVCGWYVVAHKQEFAFLAAVSPT